MDFRDLEQGICCDYRSRFSWHCFGKSWAGWPSQAPGLSWVKNSDRDEQLGYERIYDGLSVQWQCDLFNRAAERIKGVSVDKQPTTVPGMQEVLNI